MTSAPRLNAVFTAFLRLAKLLVAASISSMRQFWQMAWATSTSSAISVDQAGLSAGSG